MNHGRGGGEEAGCVVVPSLIDQTRRPGRPVRPVSLLPSPLSCLRLPGNTVKICERIFESGTSLLAVSCLARCLCTTPGEVLSRPV